jgi:hypothetical protein
VASIDERAYDIVWCWGRKGFGEISDGISTDKFVPAKIDNGDERVVKQLAVGIFHTHAILDDRTMKC